MIGISLAATFPNMHMALEVKLAAFSDGSGRKTASFHVVDSKGLICAQSSIRYTNGRTSSGAMELAGMVMALDMVTIYVEMLAPGQRLHVWFYCDNIPIVEYLIEARAVVNVEDRWGGTPLRDAGREGHRRVAKMLKAAGGEIGSKWPDRTLESDVQALLNRPD